MSDRNPEAVQFLKGLDIKSSAVGGFDKKATLAAFRQLSDIYEAALGALRTEFQKKETDLDTQRQELTAKIGEVLLQQERERREIMAQARNEADRIVKEAKVGALKQTAQLACDLEHMRDEKSSIMSELGLIREQINRVLTEAPDQPTVPCTPPASEQMSVAADYKAQ